MNDNEVYQAASAFVNLANELNKTYAEPSVIHGLTFAAARYQASNFISLGGRPEHEAQTIDRLCDLFRQMLRSNLDNIREMEAAKSR
ncbi:MAG: DUF3144 domain-containing protein [Pseudomonadota bacterium]